MMRKYPIELLTVSRTQTDQGDIVETETSRSVIADKRSVRQTEFYQASAAGYKPELVFEIYFAEYKGETKIRYNGQEYFVIRTFTKDDINLEIVCSTSLAG